jgi:hypothetical protein
MERLGSHCKDFNKIWQLSVFRKSVEKVQPSLQSDKNNVNLHENQYKCLIIPRWILLRFTDVSDTSCRENQRKYFIFSNFIFENRKVYEIMWRNIAELSRPQMKTRHMWVVCWMSKGTNTSSEYVALLFHGNSGCKNPTQCCFIRSFPILLYWTTLRLN